MRTEVQIDGIHYTARSAKELRRRGESFSKISENAARKAGDLKGRADRIEAELNKPEPLVAGDLVLWSGRTGVSITGLLLVVLQDSPMGRHLTASYGKAEVRATNGKDTFSGPASQFTKVGNINDGAK